MTPARHSTAGDTNARGRTRAAGAVHHEPLAYRIAGVRHAVEGAPSAWCICAISRSTIQLARLPFLQSRAYPTIAVPGPTKTRADQQQCQHSRRCQFTCMAQQPLLAMSYGEKSRRSAVTLGRYRRIGAAPRPLARRGGCTSVRRQSGAPPAARSPTAARHPCGASPLRTVAQQHCGLPRGAARCAHHHRRLTVAALWRCFVWEMWQWFVCE